MYKYILWDVDGTILDFIAAEAYAIRELFKKHGLGQCSDGTLKRYSAINKKYWGMLERNEMTKAEILVERFCELFSEIGVDTSLAQTFNHEYQLALGDCIVFVKDALEILKEQKGRYILAAVTNGTRVAQDKKLRASGLDKIFDHIFISENVGYEKPDERFFDAVFESLGICRKDEVIIIGDSLSSDILGGNRAGIDTVWYNPSGAENNTEASFTYEVRDLCEIRNILSE